MKYMGSKRKLLAGALSEVIGKELCGRGRFVDLFCGSGAVSQFVATRYKIPVAAVDLQMFATTIAESFLSRTQKEDGTFLANQWCSSARQVYNTSELSCFVEEWENSVRKNLRKKDVLFARQICRQNESDGPIWNAYGGYYLSLRQALQADALLATLPSRNRAECLAALIVVISKSVASPGHTAQPFQPTKKALPYIQEAWNRNVFEQIHPALKDVCNIYSNVIGSSFCGDAQTYVDTELQDGDLVFIDPPYSSVQYSRFYHVLETVTRGVKTKVEGNGRYPTIENRPQSRFSNTGTSREAMKKLLSSLSQKDVSVIITFPEGKCSNGLDSNWIVREARKYFNTRRIKSENSFSTLGGNNENRAARMSTVELILVLHKRTNSTQNNS